MHTQQRVRWLLALPGLLIMMISLAVCVFGKGTAVGLAIAALLLALTFVATVWLWTRNRWHGYAPTHQGWYFMPEGGDVPALRDHRGFFGPGRPSNVVQGPGWTSFELLHDGHRSWYFVVPLELRFPRCHVWPDPRGNVLAPFSYRYFVDGPVPERLREMLEGSSDAVDLTVLDDVLIATSLAIGPQQFEQWLAHEGQTVLGAARALDNTVPEPTESEHPAIAPADPVRNVWQPAAVREQEAEPHWTQPPRSCVG